MEKRTGGHGARAVSQTRDSGSAAGANRIRLAPEVDQDRRSMAMKSMGEDRGGEIEQGG